LTRPAGELRWRLIWALKTRGCPGVHTPPDSQLREWPNGLLGPGGSRWSELEMGLR